MLLSAWTYPLRGVLYFLAHPSLWLKVLCPLLFSIAFSLASTVVLFVFALAPQAHGLDIHLPAWLAWIIAVILVLIEICVASILFVAICLPVVADELFDAVVALSTGTAAGQGSCARGCWLGIAHAGVWILYTVFARILVLIVTAPLNLIPGAGTVLFLFLNGYLAGWNQHLHWFDLRNSGFSEGHKFVKQNRAAYMSAGAVMVLLEMIPGVGILFMFTNIVGAALWAVALEGEGIGPGPGHSSHVPRHGTVALP